MIFEPSTAFEVPSQDLLSVLFGSPVENENEPIFVDADNPERTASRAEAKTLIRKVAAGLHHIGVKHGQCVLVHALNDFHIFLFAMGCTAVGAIFSPAPFGAPEQELAALMSAAAADWIFAGPQSMETATRAAQSVGIPHAQIGLFDPPGRGQTEHTGLTYRSLLQHGERDWIRFDDAERAGTEVVLRAFTSGSTGLPKAAEIPHTYMTNIALLKAHSDRIKPFPVRMLQQAALNHITGWYVGAQVLAGCGVLHVTRSVEVADWVDLYGKFGITDLTMTPGALATACTLVEEGTKPRSSVASIRSIMNVGAPLQMKLVERIKALVAPEPVRVVSGYGSTEAGGMMVWQWPMEDTAPPITFGGNFPNIQVKLFDVDTWTEVEGNDTPGEFCVRGPGMFKGYYKNEAATAAAFYTDKDGKWYKTGDVGFFSSEKQAWILVGRSKDNFKLQNGLQIAPSEIEGALLGHTSIADAAIGPAYTDGRISGTKAWIRTKQGKTLTEDEVMRFLEGKVADVKWPRGGVKFVDMIPRNEGGKIMRAKLESL